MGIPDPINVNKNQFSEIPSQPTSSEDAVRIEKKNKTGSSLTAGGAQRGSRKSGSLVSEKKEKVEVHAHEVDKEVDALEKSENHLAAIMTHGEFLESMSPLPLKEVIEKNGPYWVDMIIAKGETAQKFNQFFNSLLFPLSYPTDQLNIFVGNPLGGIARLYDFKGIAEQTSTDIGYLQLALGLPSNLGKGSVLIYRTAIYQEVARQVELMLKQLKEEPSPELAEKIKEVQKWLKEQKDSLQEQSILVVLGLVRALPQLARIGIRISTAVGSGLGTAAGSVGVGLSTVSGGLFILFRSLQLRTATKNELEQRRWIATYQEKGRVADHTDAQKALEASQQIEDLLAKRREVFELKMSLARPDLEDFLIRMKASAAPYEEIVEQFKERGLYLERIPASEKIQTKEELVALIGQEDFHSALLEHAVAYQDTLSILARNGLKSQSLKKLKVQHRFAQFKKYSSALSLLLTILSVAITTTLTVLVLAGAISMPPFGLAIVSLTFAFAGIAVIVGGALYFFLRKPELSKEWLKGVNFRLAFYAIPTAFRSFNVQLQHVNRLRNALKAHDLSAKIYEIERLLKADKPIDVRQLPKELRPLAKKYKAAQLTTEETESLQKRLKALSDKLNLQLENNQKEALKLNEKLQKLEKKLDYWKKKQAPLEKRLVSAGLQDFLRASSLTKDVKGQQVQLSKTIVEGILSDPKLIDKETVAILTDKLGIDVAKLKNLPNQDEIKKQLIPLLDAFFAQGHDQMVGFIKKQQIKQAAQTA
jgi:hypothetical protein